MTAKAANSWQLKQKAKPQHKTLLILRHIALIRNLKEANLFSIYPATTFSFQSSRQSDSFGTTPWKEAIDD